MKSLAKSIAVERRVEIRVGEATLFQPPTAFENAG